MEKSKINILRSKLEEAGFQFEKEQKPHFQNRESELKFVHPGLIKKFIEEGYSARAKKFYIKPLADNTNSEIGLVTGKTSPLYNVELFTRPNSIDQFDNTPAWVNRDNENTLDQLLYSINKYLSTKTVKEYLNTYLFTWNPKKWQWIELDQNINQLNELGYFERRWSCGNSKRIKKGDRIFLIRLGDDPKGIMGSGYAKSTYYKAPHWDETKGKTANYIDIEFDILINPNSESLFDHDALNNIDPNNIQEWTPQQSGITIKGNLVETLESNWFNFIKENNYIGSSFMSNDVTTQIEESYKEGKLKETTQTRYERNPKARAVCLEHYGYSCQICDFNFEETFGEIGKGFIHVHHINPISEICKEYKIEPIKDLIPVCPNCHSMIHSKRPAFGVDDIRNIRDY